MKKVLLFIVCILLITPEARVFAQSSDIFTKDQAAQIQDVEGFRATFQQGVEDPATKVVKFSMILTSNIDSDRVKVKWTTTGPNHFKDISQSSGTIVVANGQTYAIPIEIVVTGYGVNELDGTVEAIKPDRTYTVSVRKNYGSNTDGEVLPITADYTNAKNANTIKNVALLISVILLIILGIFVGIRLFIKWLNKDESAAYK